MNSKQLANVLIKILGLSLFAHGIPSLVNGVVSWSQFAYDNHAPLFSDSVENSHFFMIVLLDLFPIAVGFALIFGSRWITEFLFKNEAE